MLNSVIESIYAGLINLRQDATMRLPARSMFALSQDLRLLQPIVEDIQNTRVQILQRLGVQDEENQDSFFIPPENRETLQHEMEALDNIDNNVELRKIKLSDLDNINFSLDIMNDIFPLIEEED